MNTATAAPAAPTASDLPWTLESLDLEHVERARIADDEDLFFLLCSASFVESGSDNKTFSIDAFMSQARGPEAQEALVWLFLDMFPNTPDDRDE